MLNDVEKDDDRRAYRGNLLSSTLVRKPPLDHVDVSADAITLRPLGSSPLRIERDDLDAVEFERVRLPLVWTTNIYFARRDGSRAPRSFNVLRSRSFRASLEALGWPTRDLPSRTLRHPNGGRDRWY